MDQWGGKLTTVITSSMEDKSTNKSKIKTIMTRKFMNKTILKKP